MFGLNEQQYEIYWNVKETKERDQYNNNNTVDHVINSATSLRLLSFYVNINQQENKESYQTRHTINCTLIQWKEK